MTQGRAVTEQIRTAYLDEESRGLVARARPERAIEGEYEFPSLTVVNTSCKKSAAEFAADWFLSRAREQLVCPAAMPYEQLLASWSDCTRGAEGDLHRNDLPLPGVLHQDALVSRQVHAGKRWDTAAWKRL